MPGIVGLQTKMPRGCAEPYDDTLRLCELGTCAGFRRWAHDVSRRLPRARALRVASGVAGRVMRAKSPRNLLMFNGLSAMPPQYDIVLM